jgi:hypothetical protein
MMIGQSRVEVGHRTARDFLSGWKFARGRRRGASTSLSLRGSQYHRYEKMVRLVSQSHGHPSLEIHPTKEMTSGIFFEWNTAGGRKRSSRAEKTCGSPGGQRIYEVCFRRFGFHEQIDVGFTPSRSEKLEIRGIVDIIAMHHGESPRFFRRFLRHAWHSSFRENIERKMVERVELDSRDANEWIDAGPMTDSPGTRVNAPIFLVKKTKREQRDNEPS